jgi:hypothetical protein
MTHVSLNFRWIKCCAIFPKTVREIGLGRTSMGGSDSYHQQAKFPGIPPIVRFSAQVDQQIHQRSDGEPCWALSGPTGGSKAAIRANLFVR